ncbi:MAG TPA: hypothetical protein VEA69_08920 [Tepidisphaeraceae bacterium]|nr:hypothetical protein [Tepidisphaeraceae bacterium]
MPAPPEPAPPALDYAPPPTAGRRRLRWVARRWPLWLLLAAAGLGWAYGPPAWRHGRLIRLQEACLSAELPRERPVIEADAVAAAALVAARPAEYRRNPVGHAVRVDPRWAALAAELGLPPWPDPPPGYPLWTMFCHERFTPDGRRRLVVVEGWGLHAVVTTVEPGGWAGRRPRVAWRDSAVWGPASAKAYVEAHDVPGSSRHEAGVPDPDDRSRFTVPIVRKGVHGTFELRLGDDDRVTIRLLDPDAFTARANVLRAARDRAASRPTTH